MNSKVLDMIEKEDKKNPLSDEKIAKILDMKREEVTTIRLENGIADSRERRRKLLLDETKRILKEEADISDRRLTQRLNELGYTLSRYVARQLKEDLLPGREPTTPIKENQIEEKRAFEHLIGKDGSIKMQISQAKAAIMYPPHGLHTLIHGESGVGKSQLAEAMFDYSVEAGIFPEGTPFIVFNCADYADNPQLLLSQLFGYKKGAFTGAVSDQEGVVEKANGGILFLDEVHRLSSEGQEMLFYLLDKGRYRRLGETEAARSVTILLIAATTENLESSLLETFRRRIPMMITLPKLSSRPLTERFRIVKEFFLQESKRIELDMVVKKDAMRAFMTYPCFGNIGQIKSDIQVACANAFLKFISRQRQELIVHLEDVSAHVAEGCVSGIAEVEKLSLNDLHVSLEAASGVDVQDDLTEFSIYNVIEEQHSILSKMGYSQEEEYTIIGKKMDEEFAKLIYKSEVNEVKPSYLEGILGDQIFEIVLRAVDAASKLIPDLSDNILYSLGLHIKTAYERIRNGKTIDNPQLELIKKQHPEEFQAAVKMAEVIESGLNLTLPEDEIGFLAMYLKNFGGQGQKEEGKILIVVVMHGNVGMAMAEVANKIFQVETAVGISLGFHETIDAVYEKTRRIILDNEQGKGCLLLSDMGSLTHFGNDIAKETGLDIRTISRVDTAMVIDAVRHVLMPGTSLDELEQVLNEERSIVFHTPKNSGSGKPPAVLSICMTGEGSALLAQEHAESYLRQEGIALSVLSIGACTKGGLKDEIGKIKKNYNIVAYIGNIDPKDESAPFINHYELFEGNGLVRLLKISESFGMPVKKSSLTELIWEDIIIPEFSSTYKNDMLDALIGVLEQNQCVTKDYYLSVYKRETMGATILGKAAIPHGYPEHVTKPAIGILRLKEPVLWENEFETNLILMPAFQDESGTYLKDLLKICSDESIIQQILEAEDASEIKNIILNSTIPSN